MHIEDEHRPDEPDSASGDAPDESDEEERAWQEALRRARGESADDEEERAWQEALRRARGESADEDPGTATGTATGTTTGTTTDRPAAGARAAGSGPVGAPDAPAGLPGAAPSEARPAAQGLPPPRRKRATGPDEPALPPQTVTVRRRRQTGRMDLVVPADQATPPVDLAAPAAEAPREDSAPVAPAAPSTASAVARVLADGAARSRERSREREALERVLAMAKPRTRTTRATPAVILPDENADDAENDDGGDEPGER